MIQDDVKGTFKETFTFAAPRLMEWAPSEYSPDARSFSEDQVFEFGKSILQKGTFQVSYYKAQGGAFQGSCIGGHCRRYLFKITADNYIRPGLHTVEVRVRAPEVAEGRREIRTEIKVIE